MVQKLPKTDLFTGGTTVYGTSPVFWQRYEPWTSAEAVTGYGITCRPGDLHTGYYQPPASMPPIGLSQTNATPSYGNPTTLGVADDLFCSWLWRDTEQTDGSSAVWVTLYKTAGVIGADSWRYAGVCVRASGQTLASGGTTSERLTDGDSYWFVLANKVSAGGAEWLLLRVNGGTVTELDSVAIADIADLQLQYGREIKLSVADSSGDPVLTATTKVTYGQTGTPVETTIFSHTDSSGSKLTTTGRCGFGSCQGRAEVGGSSAPVFSHFAIRNGAGDLVVRDRFKRASLIILPTALEDPLGNDGRNLLSAWIGDWRSTPLQGELQRDGDRVKIDGGLPLFGYFFSHVKYGPTQDRTATFEFPSAGTAPTQTAGLLVRANATAAANFEFGDFSGITGYTAHIRYTSSGGTWLALLYAYEQNDATLIATATIASLSLDSTWTLRFAIENQGGVSVATGIPAMDIELNGTTIPWVSAGLPGILVESGTNIVYDTRSVAIRDGSAQALVLNASGSEVFADTWTDNSAGNPTEGEDEASIVITGEAGTILGTLATDFEYGYSVDIESEPRVFRYDSGHVYRSVSQSDDRRLWTMDAVMTSAQVTALRNFWTSHQGTEIAFNWTEPDDGTALVACFDQDELGDEQTGPNSWSASLRILELFA